MPYLVSNIVFEVVHIEDGVCQVVLVLGSTHLHGIDVIVWRTNKIEVTQRKILVRLVGVFRFGICNTTNRSHESSLDIMSSLYGANMADIKHPPTNF